MELIYGLALLSAGIMLLGYAARRRNAPNASKWARSNLFMQPALFGIIASLIFGAALLVDFAANLKSERFGIVEAVLLVAIVAVTWLGWRGIRKMPAPKPLAAVTTAENVPPPANAGGPKLQTGRKAGQRKAA